MLGLKRDDNGQEVIHQDIAELTPPDTIYKYGGE